MDYENLSIEYKAQYTDRIKYEVIAFANTGGGSIYIGIDDQRQVMGVENPDNTMLQVSNMLRDSISPDITSCSDVTIQKMDGKEVVVVSVVSGSDKPYFLKEKGLTSAGVYIRHGSSSVPASEQRIREMLIETSGYSYEKAISVIQDLTFETLATAFDSRKLKFGDAQKRSLGFVGSNGLYTNLALLFSDQCPHIIRAARFCGTEKVEFQDRKDFSGSILKQVADATEYVLKYNQLHAKVIGFLREDNYDYPEDALREAIFNAVIHRDYSNQAQNIQLSIFDDKVRISNPGALLDGYSKEDLYNGISARRNPGVAEIFYRLVLIEAYGTGFPKIINAYDKYDRKPSIVSTKVSFVIDLPNTNFVSSDDKNDGTDYYARFRHADIEVRENEEPRYYAIQASPRTEQIVELLNRHGVITRDQLQEKLGVSQATAILDIKNLLLRGIIKKVGQGKQTQYELK